MTCPIMATPRALSPAGDAGDIEGVEDMEVTTAPPEFGDIRGVGGAWGLEGHWGHGATGSCTNRDTHHGPLSLGDSGDVIWGCHRLRSGLWDHCSPTEAMEATKPCSWPVPAVPSTVSSTVSPSLSLAG